MIEGEFRGEMFERASPHRLDQCDCHSKVRRSSRTKHNKVVAKVMEAAESDLRGKDMSVPDEIRPWIANSELRCCASGHSGQLDDILKMIVR